MLVNRYILSDHVLRSIQRSTGSFAVFLLGEGSGYENILSEIASPDKIFNVLTEGLALRSLVSLTVLKGAVIFHSEMSRVVLLCFRILHPRLTLDG